MNEEQLKALRRRLDELRDNALTSAITKTTLPAVAYERGRHDVVHELETFLADLFDEQRPVSEVVPYVRNTATIKWEV